MTLRPANSPLPDLPYLKVDETVTLTNCDREPIHMLGHIQPHGVLLVLDPNTLEVVQHSQNAEQLGQGQLLGRTAASLFGATLTEELREACASIESNPLQLFRWGEQWNVVGHTYDGLLLLELEPSDGTDSNGYLLARQALTRLRRVEGSTAYLTQVCEEIAQISGFDRVMVYRFHPDAHGEVVAEKISPADTREPYLGLHYPESDIPKQARALYLVNSNRLMPDSTYTPSPLIPAVNPCTGRHLDMSFCSLRGYSKMYTEYLTNMGARASMSLAILHGEKLWGLIACHHQTRRVVPFEVRAACEVVSNVVSLQIADKLRFEDRNEDLRSQDLLRHLIERMAVSRNVAQSLLEEGSTALGLLAGDGFAIWSGGALRGSVGAVPPPEFIESLVAWIGREPVQVYSSDHLASVFPAALDHLETSAGVLAIWMSASVLLWFRREVALTVKWGGNPTKPYAIGPSGLELNPRNSFELWKETVRERSQPWLDSELESARNLRTAAAEIALRYSEEMAVLNEQLQARNDELDSFAYLVSHDLKEPLRGIFNNIQFLVEDFGESLPQGSGARLDSVLRIARRMESLLNSLLDFSRVGRLQFQHNRLDINRLLQGVQEVVAPRLQQHGCELRIPRPLPTVGGDPVQLAEVWTNLIINGAKYSDRPAGERWVEVGYEGPVGDPTFYVRDNGIGIGPEHWESVFGLFKRLHGREKYGGGSGAGLTIARKIVERHGGRLWLESTPGQGTTFYFKIASERMLPAAAGESPEGGS